MAQSKADKKTAKRKAKQKEKRVRKEQLLRRDKLDFLLYEAESLRQDEAYDSALNALTRVLRLAPFNREALAEMVLLGSLMGRDDVQLKGLLGLYEQGQLPIDHYPPLCDLLFRSGRIEEALKVADNGLHRIPQYENQGKTDDKDLFDPDAGRVPKPLGGKGCAETKTGGQTRSQGILGKRGHPCEQGRFAACLPHLPLSRNRISPAYPVILELDDGAFRQALEQSLPSSPERYELAIQAHQTRLKETFDRLICFGSLRNVQSLWYQEETARKVLKRYRGRALLADEVGLGKTIEALIVLKEYIQRGMVKSGLILVPDAAGQPVAR